MARSYVRVYPPTSVKTTNRPLWTQTCFIQRPTLVHGSDSTVHVSVWASYTIDYSRVSGDQTPADLYMAMLTNGAARGRRFAAWALAILAHKNAANKVAIVAAGAVDPLYALARAGGSSKKAAEVALEQLNLATIASRLQALEAEKASNCVVCHERAREVAFDPCGHFVCCSGCGLRVSTCPLCRGAIERNLRIYVG